MPKEDCSPGYFKVKPGTGIQGQTTAYCPYCRHEDAPNDFATKEQVRYAKDALVREAQKQLGNMVKEALGIGSSGRRTFGKGGLITMEIKHKAGHLPPVRRPFEDEVRRDVICPHCTLDQTVFGLATWCADCGADVFMTHVTAELNVTQLMVGDVARRREQLGERVAAKDLENCLEDAVSIFEASLKAIVRRRHVADGKVAEEVHVSLKRIGNAFQSIERTREQLKSLFGLDIGADPLWERLADWFEKRHPVTHNLGVIDKKYMERTQAAEREGREVRLSAKEITTLLVDVRQAIEAVFQGLIARTT